MFAPEAISKMQPKKLVYNQVFIDKDVWPEHTAYLKCTFQNCSNMSPTSVLYDCNIVGDIGAFMEDVNGLPITMTQDGRVLEAAILDSHFTHKGEHKTYEFESRDTIIGH